MTLRGDIPPSDRTQPSALDRGAISVAGHLLMGGVWMERQLVQAPRLLSSLFGNTSHPTKSSMIAPSGKTAS
jgi:hypothetical protein